MPIGKLTGIERLILANQFKILAMKSKDSEWKKFYEETADALYRGHSWIYRSNLPFVLEEECDQCATELVHEVLPLFEHMRESFEALPSGSGIASGDIEFTRFDQHSDTWRVASVLKKQGLHGSVLANLDNHRLPHLGDAVLRRMLDEWEKMGKPDRLLTADEIRRLLDAQIHPEHRRAA